MKLVTALLLLQVASLAFALPFFDRGEMGWNMKGQGNEFFAMFKFPDGTWNLRMMRMFLNMIKSMDLNTRSDWFKNLYSTEGENDVVEPESYEEPEFVEFIDQPKSGKYKAGLLMSAKWVCTDMKGKSRSRTFDIQLEKLLKYRKANKISTTTPVITKVEENDYTTCIYLPKANQKTTPEPTSQDLYIHKKSNLKIFKLHVPEKSVSDQQWLQAKEELETYIREEGKHVDGYNNSFYYTAVYNDPAGQNKGHSEIWFLDV